MRLDIPGLTVVLTFERRPLGPFRFRVRTLMVAVALVGLVLGGIEARRLERARRDYRARAAEFAALEYVSRTASQVQLSNLPRYPDEKDRRSILAGAEASRRSAERNGLLRRKYEHAARYPWLPVAPDPPPG